MIREYTVADMSAHAALFESMYRDRKRVFVDLLKWDIAHERGLERDAFDGPDARYLILDDHQSGEHLGSVRLLPTIKPHLMSEVFPHLCEGGVPIGRQIWEITRFVVSPRVGRRDRLTVRNKLGRAMIEFGVAKNIRSYTCVCDIGFLSQLLASNWHIEHLGMPLTSGNSMIAALSIRCDFDSIGRTDPYWQVDGPVLIDTVPALAA